MNRNAYIALGVVVALALFGGGFAVGRAFAPPSATTDAPAAATGPNAARRAAAQGVLGQGAQALMGRVISVQEGSITIEVRQPPAQAGASPSTSSAIALVGSNTRIVRTSETPIAPGDIKAGDQVTVVGTTDPATGTVSATSVLVGGVGQILGGRGGAPVPSPSPTGR